MRGERCLRRLGCRAPTPAPTILAGTWRCEEVAQSVQPYQCRRPLGIRQRNCPGSVTHHNQSLGHISGPLPRKPNRRSHGVTSSVSTGIHIVSSNRQKNNPDRPRVILVRYASLDMLRVPASRTKTPTGASDHDDEFPVGMSAKFLYCHDITHGDLVSLE